MFKKLSLELGGKNPNIIFADCDFEKMIKTTLQSSFANQGQICLCGSRIMIERPLYEKFKTEFVARVQKMKVGNPAADVKQQSQPRNGNHPGNRVGHSGIDGGGPLSCNPGKGYQCHPSHASKVEVVWARPARGTRACASANPQSKRGHNRFPKNRPALLK